MSSASTNSQPQPAAPKIVPPPSVPDRLDELLDLDADELAALYRAASVPKIADVKGDLRGRMLAIPALGEVGVLGPLTRALRAFAGSRAFPWLGKTFTPLADDHGEGRNRVFTDRLQIFRFTTSIGRSRFGEFDALQLDYDHAGNPWVIRIIKDELRQLHPRLWLGQAWLQPREKPTLGLYFGLELP